MRFPAPFAFPQAPSAGLGRSVPLTRGTGPYYIQIHTQICGRSRTRFVGRVQATLGLGRHGSF